MLLINALSDCFEIMIVDALAQEQNLQLVFYSNGPVLQRAVRSIAVVVHDKMICPRSIN